MKKRPERVSENLHASTLAQNKERKKSPLQYEQKASIFAVRQTEFRLSVWSKKPKKRS